MHFTVRFNINCTSRIEREVDEQIKNFSLHLLRLEIVVKLVMLLPQGCWKIIDNDCIYSVYTNVR